MTSPALTLFHKLAWLDGSPLLSRIEPYRQRLFEYAFARDAAGGLCHNLILFGRAKKNWKTADLVLGALAALLIDSPGGNQCYLLANDKDQANDDLTLAKKIIAANPQLRQWLNDEKRNVIERKDGRGFLEILAAQDAVGSHGKTYRFCGFDEIHGYSNWDLLEALQHDPTRTDAQMWITSYASLFHRPGVPLYDLFAQGKAGTDRRMLFSWYAADFTTDAAFANATPEDRANPSRGSWADPDYLAQQQRRLPSHKYRRLHLNLPGLPEGSAFQAEPVMDAIARGIVVRLPDPHQTYVAFVDMSGGSIDDAVLAIVHLDAAGRVIVDRVTDQGARPPFDPRFAVERFVTVCREYRVSSVTGDKYAGETFVADFRRFGISYRVSVRSKSQLYEALEPLLNGRRVVLLDLPILEQQLLGLRWTGGKIDHPNGEHDDHVNAVAGAVVQATTARSLTAEQMARILGPGGRGVRVARPA